MKRILIAPLLALPFAIVLAHSSHHCPLRPAPEQAPAVVVAAPAAPVAIAPSAPDEAALLASVVAAEARERYAELARASSVTLEGPPARGFRPREFWTIAPHEPGEVGLVSSKSAALDDDAGTRAVREAAVEVAACFRRGDAAAAEAIISRTTSLVLWDRLAGSVKLAAHFRSNDEGARLGVTVSRSSKGEKAIGVVIPPGSYGVAPHAQELAILRAAVVVLAPDETEARIDLPVACASFHENAPAAGRQYELRRYPDGSAISKLLALLCAGDPAPEPASQLAVWITANHVTYAQVAAQRGLLTFESFEHVGVGDASAAAELIRRAGLEPRREPFFLPSGARTPRQEEVLPELVESPL